MQIWIPSRATLSAGAMWLAALVLMAWDTLDGSRNQVGRWALLVGMGAMTWTLVLTANHCRRVVLEVMSWEHWMMDKVKEEEQEGGKIRAIR